MNQVRGYLCHEILTKRCDQIMDLPREGFPAEEGQTASGN